MSFTIKGVHPVESDETCYVIEAKLSDAEHFNWDEVTQEDPTLPKANWQVAYDEQSLGKERWVFFFHFLDLTRPLLTPSGEVRLPNPTPRPDHLAMIDYEAP